MNQPTYTQFTERMYANLPEVVRNADALNDYALKKYISAIGDVEDRVERLVARFTYLSKTERLTLGNLVDDHSYYGLDYSYFQTTGSKYSAKITNEPEDTFYLRSQQAYRIVPNTLIYVGAVFRTDNPSTENAYGLRLWYYDASMTLIDMKDVGQHNGSAGPQWVVVNSNDLTPDTAFYVRVSPFSANTSDTDSNLWVDDVYVRSHYEVTTTNNLVSGGHNFTMRTERELIKQGDFDALSAQADQAERDSLLSEWDRGPGTSLVEKALDGVPDIQSYRTWLELGSTTADQPGYARQVITGIEPNSTYTISVLMVRDANVPDDSTVRVTVTPDTGGPTVRTFTMESYEQNVPSLLTFTWNSPEAVSTAIVGIEYVTATMPAQGLLINDVSMVWFTSDVSMIGRQGAPVTYPATERAGVEMFTGRDVRGAGWIRYITQGDPDSEPMSASEPDDPSGTSFIETGWHQTRPGNTYTFSGDIFSNNSANYVDLIIWHRNEGKGWGDAMLHRIYATPLNEWMRFDRAITIPPGATEFRVNLDVYRSSSERVLNLRNVSLTPTSSRSWYMSGARPFGYNAIATKSMNYLSRGDLMHYTANLMVTGNPGGGRYGIRVYSNDSKVVHETLISTTKKDQLVSITGSFQVPETQAELRGVLFVSDPTPKHQAAYFISDLEVVHSTQQYVDEPQNLVTNGGFESTNALEGWNLLTEREIVRKNLVTNPSYEPTNSGALPRPNNAGYMVSSSTKYYHTGNTSVQAEVVTGGVGGLIMSLYDIANGTVGLAVTPGNSYVISAWFMTHVPGASAYLSMRFQNAANEYMGQNQSPTTYLTPGLWTQISMVVTAPPDAASFWYTSAYVSAPGFAQPGQKAWIDSVLVSDYVNDVSYFSKDTADTPFSTYSWDGEAHVETRREYPAPVNPSAYLTTDMGYNEEDVPDRPEDLPLGSTSDLVDPRTANTEWLPWLAQFVGRNISHFSTMEEARTALASDNNFSAGTIDAIRGAVQAVLTGTKTVRVFPMTATLNAIGGATQWDVSIVTRTSESPDISVMEEAVRLRNAKPAGVVFHFHKHQSTWDAVEIANPTWDVWDTRTWTQLEESGLED